MGAYPQASNIRIRLGEAVRWATDTNFEIRETLCIARGDDRDGRDQAERDDLPGGNAAGPDSYGGFWHCNGSPDGRWAAGDTFTGNVWLIDRRDGRRILLTTDHKMKPDHTHPTFSDDSKRILIQSGHFTDGKRLQLIVIPMPASLK